MSLEEQKYTLKDIQEMLGELDLIWIDKLLCGNSNNYRTAMLIDFHGTTHLLVRRSDSKRPMLATVKVSNETFKIKNGSTSMDASSIWRELLQTNHGITQE